ncbi:DUF1493 family protein [Sinomicrobium pectinilyticum]|uniref:DUF1493 family protein n=1 Tax=Sinomicrobium pectinilyticum TaxID=1084421 RepID=A0A3N0CYX5_SINP1|nr:DUF1493 family protein [Sinomicrobium pectinilyticum]RNL68615.1 DUF1493 family protein [Sinomicrobium pectinilyticum]
MNSKIIEEIVALIPEIFHPKKREITRDLELEEDLGITGDDADEILSIFAERFNVDIKEFNSKDYFLEEGVDLIGALKSWLLGSKIKKEGRKRLTIGDLEEAVKKGKLK